MQLIYSILTILGFVLPYSQLTPFFAENGLNLPLFWSQLFANQISSDFALDLIISSVVFWIFLLREGNKWQMKFLWIYIILNLIVGLSFALPFFLWMRVRHLGRQLPGELT